MFHLNPNWSACYKYTHLQINLIFTTDSSESLVYDVLQLNVLHTGHFMFQLVRYSRYRSIFSQRKLLTLDVILRTCQNGFTVHTVYTRYLRQLYEQSSVRRSKQVMKFCVILQTEMSKSICQRLAN
ncbi:hypothetical protein CSKR_111584 [Clonorchis sinensis]|uniref:Uncharacterized protein n=1 Tax=Clonorchis sinensis TaxID=79923 RepID=A0A3R7JJ62_CLOSI|nr:hypothetical protein CSKR_111584 [Clonorchis sinensis]